MLSFLKNLIIHLFYSTKIINQKALEFRKKREQRYIHFFETVNTDEDTTAALSDEEGGPLRDFLRDLSDKLGIASTDEIETLKLKIELLNKKLEALSKKM